jgi:hypothetical protein
LISLGVLRLQGIDRQQREEEQQEVSHVAKAKQICVTSLTLNLEPPFKKSNYA